MSDTRKDVVIIGSGPAGLSAAVYAKRALLDVAVIEKEMFSGGQIVTTDRVDNLLGFYGTNGYDLSVKFRKHADALEVPFMEGTVTDIANQDDYKEVHLEDGSVIETKAVIVATGAAHRKLGVEGEAKFAGAGVSYCATCDGAFFRNKTVAVAQDQISAIWVEGSLMVHFSGIKRWPLSVAVMWHLKMPCTLQMYVRRST